MATYTHCLVGTLQVQDYLSKIIWIIQDYMDISKCEIKMSTRWRWAWDVMRVRCFDDFEGVLDQCLRLDLRFQNWLRNNMARFNSLRLVSMGFTSWIDFISMAFITRFMCFTSHWEDVFIMSWIFDNSQLVGTKRILMEWHISDKYEPSHSHSHTQRVIKDHESV